MKKIILLLTIVAFFSPAQAQKLMANDVPVAVTAEFSSTHPSIQVIDWNQDGNYYEAEYNANKVDRTVTYDVTGEVIETGELILVSALPLSAIEYVKMNYKDAVVNEVSRITDAKDRVTYKVQVKGMDLIFDSEGNFVRSVQGKS